MASTGAAQPVRSRGPVVTSLWPAGRRMGGLVHHVMQAAVSAHRLCRGAPTRERVGERTGEAPRRGRQL